MSIQRIGPQIPDDISPESNLWISFFIVFVFVDPVRLELTTP